MLVRLLAQLIVFKEKKSGNSSRKSSDVALKHMELRLLTGFHNNGEDAGTTDPTILPAASGPH